MNEQQKPSRTPGRRGLCTSNAWCVASGCRVSIVGPSAGDIHARELAKFDPVVVRQVITSGCPFNDPDSDARNVSSLYAMFTPEHKAKTRRFLCERWDLPATLPAPATSIYSKFEDVCHWRVYVQHSGHDQIENIEVLGSHAAMAVNAQTRFIIADRLLQRRSEWRPTPIGRYPELQPLARRCREVVT